MFFSYVKKLQEDVKSKTNADPKTDEEKLKVMGLKTTSNIQTLIRDLFHSPPSFKSIVRLSWVAPKTKNTITIESDKKVEADKTPTTPTATKRHVPITFDSGNAADTKGPKQAKSSNGNGQQMYSPPGGKFSSKFNSSGRSGGNRNGSGGNKFKSGGNRRNFNNRRY